MKTFSAREQDIDRKWYVVDAQGKTLGRLSTEIATILRGKHKPIFTPHVDCGDYVIVINADKVWVTGLKLDQKRYYRHSGYPGGLKVRTLEELMKKKPEDVVYRAVKGMVPHTKLGRAQLRKLRVYAGPEHEQQAQNPQPKSS